MSLNIKTLRAMHDKMLHFQRENCSQFLVPLIKFMQFRRELKRIYPNLRYVRAPKPARAVWEVWDNGYLVCRIYVTTHGLEIFHVPSQRKIQENLFNGSKV